MSDFHFYPRPPRGGRPLIQSRLDETKIISIHALREEGDPMPQILFISSLSFLSTPSARRATAFHTSVGELRRISIHALREEGDPATSTPMAL